MKNLRYRRLSRQSNFILCWRNLAFLSTALFLLVFDGCQTKLRDNPLDPGGVAFQKPSVTFISPFGNDTTVYSNSVVFAWTGNSAIYRYRYKLTNNLTNDVFYPLSPWDTISTATFSYLDDSPYSFSLETEYNGIDSSDTVYNKTLWVYPPPQGPALVFVKKQPTQSLLSQFEIDVWGEDLPGVFVADISIAFDPTMIEFDAVYAGDHQSSPGVSQYVFLDPVPNPVDQANQTGQIRVSTMFLAQSADGNTLFSGNGSFLKLMFTAIKSGQSNVSFLHTDLRDTSDDSLSDSTGHAAVVYTNQN